MAGRHLCVAEECSQGGSLHDHQQPSVAVMRYLYGLGLYTYG